MGTVTLADPIVQRDVLSAKGRRSRHAVRVALVVILLAATATLTWFQVQTQETRSHLGALVTQRRHEIHDLQSEITTSRHDLMTATYLQAATHGRRDQAVAALHSTYEAISRDSTGIFEQYVGITNLEACLSDVQQALNEAAVGDTQTAAAILATAQTDCNLASAYH